MARTAKLCAVSLVWLVFIAGALHAQKVPEAIACTGNTAKTPMVCAKASPTLTALPQNAGQPYLYTADNWRTVYAGVFPEQKQSFDPVRRVPAAAAELRFALPRNIQRVNLTLSTVKNEWWWQGASSVLAPLSRIVLPPGKYKLRISADHFQTRSMDIEATAGSVLRLGTVELAPAKVLTGVVVDEATGTPLAGATLSTPDDAVLAIADGGGGFHAEVIDPEVRFVLFGQGGYATAKIPLASIEPNSRIALSRAATLKLEIDPGESTTKTIKVGLARETDDAWSKVAQKEVPAAKAAANFGNLLPGKYRITLQGDAPLALMTSEIELQAGQTTPYRMHIAPGNLLVSVMFADQPLTEGAVEIANSERGIRGTVTLNDRGQAATEAWQGGTILAIVRSPAMPTPFLQYRTVELQPEMRLDLNIPNRRVVGRVLDRTTGRPIAEADVTLSSQGNGESSSVVAETDSVGHFEFKGVKPGTHSIDALADKHLKGSPIAFVMADEESLKNIDITLDPGRQRTVHVTSSGASVPRGAVVVLANGRMVAQEMTDRAGNVVVPTPEQTSVLLLIGGPDGSLAMRRLPSAVADGDESTIEIPLPPPVATIKITARSEDQKPIAGIGLLLRFDGELIPLEAAPALHVSLFTNAAGEAVLPHVPEGVYHFWPFEDPDEATAIVSSAPPPAVELRARPGINQADITFKER